MVLLRGTVKNRAVYQKKFLFIMVSDFEFRLFLQTEHTHRWRGMLHHFHIGGLRRLDALCFFVNEFHSILVVQSPLALPYLFRVISIIALHCLLNCIVQMWMLLLVYQLYFHIVNFFLKILHFFPVALLFFWIRTFFALGLSVNIHYLFHKFLLLLFFLF